MTPILSSKQLLLGYDQGRDHTYVGKHVAILMAVHSKLDSINKHVYFATKKQILQIIYQWPSAVHTQISRV